MNGVSSQLLQRTGNSKVRVGVCDTIGRRRGMEDAVSIQLKFAPDAHFIGVFDGHGGEWAASWIAENLPPILAGYNYFVPEDVKAACLEADCQLRAALQKAGQTDMVGTCAVFGVIKANPTDPKKFNVLIGNIGDSRCVVLSKDSHRCLTADHKPSCELETSRIINAGSYVSSDNRVDGMLAVSRAFGDFEFKNNGKLDEDAQSVIATPDITITEVDADDMLIFMCDGIYEGSTMENVVGWFREALQTFPNDPARVVSRVIGFNRVSADNMSAVMVQFTDGSEYLSPYGEYEYLPCDSRRLPSYSRSSFNNYDERCKAIISSSVRSEVCGAAAR